MYLHYDAVDGDADGMTTLQRFKFYLHHFTILELES